MTVGVSETGSGLAAGAHGVPVDGQRLAAALLSGFGLFVMILTFQPFAGVPDAIEPGGSTGNIVNQIGYVSLAIVYLVAMLKLCERGVLAQMATSSWLVVLMVAAFSAGRALEPDAALRALLLTGFAMVPVLGVLVLPRHERDFASAVANAALAVLVLVYVALLLAPQLAIHGSEGVEGGHAGDWRGHLTHKNFAAPVFSILIMFGIYCWRMGLRLRGFAIIALGAIFVLNSGSKTTMGFLPIAIALVLFGRALGRPRLILLGHGALVLLIAALTVGTVFSPALLQLASALTSDPTFTGRDEIWRFASAHIGEKPWLGHGYFSFWQTPLVTALEENFEARWDIRGIGSAHNSYLDAMLMFGLPGAMLVIFCLMILPLRNYLRAQRDPARQKLADLFVMIVIFMTYVGMLESFFLNRADPLWLLFALAVLGLELASRLRTKRV
ncbi:MAG: O-antigen ligase family protein [Bosea sp.]|uniref:O-antigen ligase family protein n=1 Tax=Bosea sp. (in: a-proteobacteria) TaxID=1871050 RepID=UPI001AD53DBD|nr:O-antigen ligase [Bosea sp. (in: a-proteobacteria)]MBN9469449.1 O-antigen ligase family protein [Bosea sp. (in: a-proteobacteria)]